MTKRAKTRRFQNPEKSWNVTMTGEITPNSKTVNAVKLVVTDVGTLIFSGADGTITAAFPPATYLWVEGGGPPQFGRTAPA